MSHEFLNLPPAAVSPSDLELGSLRSLNASVIARGVLRAGQMPLSLQPSCFPPPPSCTRGRGWELGWAELVGAWCSSLLLERERGSSLLLFQLSGSLGSGYWQHSRKERCGFPQEGGNKAGVEMRAQYLFSGTWFCPEWIFLTLEYYTRGCNTLEWKRSHLGSEP